MDLFAVAFLCLLPWLVFAGPVQQQQLRNRRLPTQSHHGSGVGQLEALARTRKRWGGTGSSELEETVAGNRALPAAMRKRSNDLPDGRTRMQMSSHQLDAFFTADIGIGDPPQTLPVIIDTGSSDL
jgi:hypothetical protein